MKKILVALIVATSMLTACGKLSGDKFSGKTYQGTWKYDKKKGDKMHFKGEGKADFIHTGAEYGPKIEEIKYEYDKEANTLKLTNFLTEVVPINSDGSFEYHNWIFTEEK